MKNSIHIALFIHLLACMLLSGVPLRVCAQSVAGDKIALMADALRARAECDFDTAKAKLEELIRLAPDDVNVQRLLGSVNDELARRRQNESARNFSPLPMTEIAAPPVSLERVPPGPASPLAATASEDSPTAKFEAEQLEIEAMLLRGRAQYIAGDYEGARETFSQVEASDPNNREAKKLQAEIARTLRRSGILDRKKTKEQMLQEVTQGWQRPQIFDRDRTTVVEDHDNSLEVKLTSIMMPRVSFSGLPLSRVVDTLAALSEEYDPDGEGVNMVLIDPSGSDPAVNLTLRGLSLARVLDFTTESVGYEYDVQEDAVVVRQGQGGSGSRLETEFFPISRSTIIRLTGISSNRSGGSGSSLSDPFAPTPLTAGGDGDLAGNEEALLKNFLQRAGVGFDLIDGANLALADGQLIVTQSPRNMEKVRNILRRYTEVKQVEIEARFLEVRQGDLEELGFNWAVNVAGDNEANFGRFSNSTRTLSDAFGVGQSESRLAVTSADSTDEAGNLVPGLNMLLPVLSPAIPNTLDLASDAVGGLANIAGVIGDAEVGLVIRALERQSGNDLMSAPKVTVLSGKTAEITVAQEMRYPESYGDIEAQVGKGDSSGGSAGVAITAGTPENFVVRNVGVEMEVTPTVEDDNSISLLLEPRVTEFEGFVEYGGSSVAIASNTTVTVPSGFFQPIFSVRRVRTEVTIWDGATLVMGGLTREQAVSTEDKVPVLGDIPILGRLFQSKGKSAEKRNLLIFVTANLISPGGSPQRQQFRTTDPGSLFQNPTIVTPGGAVNRGTTGTE